MIENKLFENSERKELNCLFAELACESATLANLILEQYPEYRRAKEQMTHPFWTQTSRLMRRDLLQALSVSEIEAGQLLAA